MLAEGRTAQRRTLSRVLLLLLLAAVVATSLLPSSRGDIPTPVPNGDASRTVTWGLNTSESLIPDNVSFGGGRVVLPWVRQNLSWTDASQIAATGPLPPTMSVNASGLGLRTNWSNYVRNPMFNEDQGWAYRNGTTGNVTAYRNTSLDVAELGANWTGDQTLWESMDNEAAHWLAAPNSVTYQNGTTNPVPKEGSGSLGIGAFPKAASSVGAVNSSLSPALNWSSYDRMVLWIYMNVSIGATFNLTAHAGLAGPLVTTVAQPLTVQRGWQEVVVDLEQLGDATVRGNLYQVGLRVNALSVFPANTWFNIDDVRLGVAKIVNESAWVAQEIPKPFSTFALNGSAHLSFDWCILGDVGTNAVAASVSLAAVGSYDFVPLPASLTGVWQVYSSDVSAGTTAADAYNVTFALDLAANTTAPYAIALLIDNVTLVFPNATNGTFQSNVLSMGSASQYLSLSWSGPLPEPTGTSVAVGVRTGNTSVPGSASWSAWEFITARGPVPLTVPGAMNYQLRIDLSTTNASESPLLQALTLETRHRGSSGMLTSELFPADADFLRWRTIEANVSLPPKTSIQFYLGNGSSLASVQLGANLTAYTGGPSIRWRAVLQTLDGLATPSLFNVTLVYEYLGPPSRVVMTQFNAPVRPGQVVNVTTGHIAYFGVLVYDAGSHPIPSTAFTQGWTISNGTGGSLLQNGTYTAGKPGLYQIGVIISGGGATIHGSVWVNVTVATSSSSTPFSLWDAWPLLAVGVAALVGFSLYEVLIRRLFAIDDVFLIAKDGRLMIHNTRRMRADRDEDILSGMLTAIMAFLRDQDPEENGELKRFEVGGKTTLLERGEHVYLAAIYSGRLPGWAGKDLHRFMTDLESKFGDAFAVWTGSPEDLRDLKEFTQRFVTRVRYHRGARNPGNET